MKSYTDRRKDETTRKVEELTACLLNKTITEVQVVKTWRDTEIEKIFIIFSDGTAIDIYAHSEKGCSECDSDGSLPDYLDFYAHKSVKLA